MEPFPSSLQNLLTKSRVKHYPKGQIIQYAEDKVTYVMILKTGVVKVYDIDSQGNEKILHVVKSPSLIPFAFFSGHQATTKWFYSALTDCNAYYLDEITLRQAMKEDAALAVFLTETFSRDVHELLVRLSSLGKTNTQDKLLAALRFLAVCHSKQQAGGWWRVGFPVNHQLLADMTGVTRESIAVSMKDIQQTKIIRNPRLTILEINKDKLLESIH